jgi:hypothetical protein
MMAADFSDTGFSEATTASIATAREHSIGALLHRSARRTPDKTAIINGDVTLTFAELDTAVNRCANALTERGLRRGDRLALVSHNCWQFAVLNFAAARIGAILVPVNFGLGADEIAFILSHSGARGVVVEDALGQTVIDAIDRAAAVIDIQGWIALSGTPAPDGFQDATEWMSSGDATAVGVVIGDDEPVRMMYTSGTESRPKGVLLSSKSLISQYVSCIIDGGMTADDVEIHSLPLYHCAQLDCFLSTDIYLGATSIILPAPDPATILATIESARATKLFCPPTVWISLLRHPDFDTRDLSSLRKGYSVRHRCRSRCCVNCPAGCPTYNYGTSTDRPRCRRWQRFCNRTNRSTAPDRPGAPHSTSRPGSSTTTGIRCPPARSARSCTAVPMRHWGITATRRRPPRRSRAAGSTPVTSASSTRTAISASSTARRT